MSNDPVLKQTPLFHEHEKLGAKMTGFGGWNMPLYYSSIVDEHHAVRNQLGIFDISHMGQFEVSGPAANEWLNCLATFWLPQSGQAGSGSDIPTSSSKWDSQLMQTYS